MKKSPKTFIEKKIIGHAIKDSFKKLNPIHLFKNPVIFITWLGAFIISLDLAFDFYNLKISFFDCQIAFWLWFTVLFANFAESLAEGRGKAQAESLKQGQVEIFANKMNGTSIEKIPAHTLKKGDIVVCKANDFIPLDGEVIEGIASIDESAITGESAPVIRESGGDRSAVTGGTKVISDRIVVKITSNPGNSFIDHIISLIEAADRQKTPGEIALGIVLIAFTIILFLAVASLKFFAIYTSNYAFEEFSKLVDLTFLISLFICLIPTTIGGLLSAIGIAGMDRLIAKNIIAKSGRAIEAAGDIDVLLIDKTGTITLGNRTAVDFIPAPNISSYDLAQNAQMASLADETPEGRSIVILAKEKFQLRAKSLSLGSSHFVLFSASTKMSGVDITSPPFKIRKGAVDAIKKFINEYGGIFPDELNIIVEQISISGGTPLAVAKNGEVLGIIHLKDMVKNGIKERFHDLRKMGIRTIMITGDNPSTAAAIAAEAGVDDFIAEATPESKLERIREEQKKGHLVAMTGDGTNDAPALAQADVAIAMNTGTQAAREAGNLVDLDSNPTKIIEIVEIGKQLLMTRGALTTFSIANDLAKYFAILPPLFAYLYKGQNAYGPLNKFNIMDLHSLKSAILSAVIFNALIIIFLIPLALRGIPYKAQSSHSLLRKNLIIYGLGGLICPFIGIKIIDMIVIALSLAK